MMKRERKRAQEDEPIFSLRVQSYMYLLRPFSITLLLEDEEEGERLYRFNEQTMFGNISGITELWQCPAMVTGAV